MNLKMKNGFLLTERLPEQRALHNGIKYTEATGKKSIIKVKIVASDNKDFPKDSIAAIREYSGDAINLNEQDLILVHKEDICILWENSTKTM